MNSLVIKSVLTIVIPLCFLLIILGKRERNVIFSLVIGSACCLLAYYVDNGVYNLLNCGYTDLTINYSPMIEEVIKFIPIILVAIFYSKDKNKLVPIAFAIGIGYALVENSYLLMEYLDNANIGWLLLRGVGAGLMHSVVASGVAYGLSICLADKRLKVIGSISLLFFAITYHATYNCLVQMEYLTFVAILLTLGTFLAVFIMLRNSQEEAEG